MEFRRLTASDLPSLLELYRQLDADDAESTMEHSIRPIIYQSMLDDNWFGNIKDDLTAAGFRSWVEDQEYMLPAGKNLITPNPEVEVRKVTKWQDELERYSGKQKNPGKSR